MTDLSAIETAISDNQVCRIIHTAAILPPTSEEYPCRGCDVNIGGTNNIFDAASRLGVKRMVYPSSIAVYGDQSDHGETVLNEESPRFPFSLYGVAKQANELAAHAYLANTGLDSRGLRICTVFGHGRVTGRSAAASRPTSRRSALRSCAGRGSSRRPKPSRCRNWAIMRHQGTVWGQIWLHN